MTTMHPLFAAILQIMEPPIPVQDATPARAEQGAHISRPGSSCRGCGGGGILPEGGSCGWCSEGDDWNGVIYGEKDSD
jgi:hypothetical protein